MMIEHKGYIGHFAFDEKTNLFHGRAANYHHLITFQGKSVKETHQAFRDAVDEHLEWCKKHGKKVEKSSAVED